MSATKYLPELEKWIVPAKNVVNMMEHPAMWQKVGVSISYPAKYLPEQLLEAGRRIILDFGETLVGKVRLRIESLKAPDSPIRLKILAAELPYEAHHDPDTYTSGLSRGWLQEELVTAYELPEEIELPRRYSLRYLVIDIVASPRNCGMKITKAEIIAQSAVGEKLPSPLPGWDKELALIDSASSRTLRNCMQEVPEDGPKRDRRLWLGDLRLQALVNHVTFRRYDLFENGIRLLHSCKDERNMIPGAILMNPEPHGSSFVFDYSLIFGKMLFEHCCFSGNLNIGDEFFADAEYQLNFFRNALDEKGNFHHPGIWTVIDHGLTLDRTTPLIATAIWAAEGVAELAELLNKPENKAERIRNEAEKWRKMLRNNAFDPETGLLRSGHTGQLTWAGQIWGILAGVLSPQEGSLILKQFYSRQDMLKPQSPYLMHYFLEACQLCGMEELLFDTVRKYWGGMIRKGADTFWEIYNEDDDFYTPYGDGTDPRNNSACHAWSSTPGYFLRKADK